MSGHPPALIWFRRDLRLDDHPALSEAAATGAPLIGVYVLDDPGPGVWVEGAAARWWLHHSLAALATALAAHGMPLVLRRGRPEEAIPRLAAETGARAIHWSRDVEPRWRGAAAAIRRAVGPRVTCHEAAGNTLLASDGRPHKVFTPFWRARLRRAGEIAAPLPPPAALRGPATAPPGDRLEDWGLIPRAPDWAAGFHAVWRPGAAGAAARMADFLDGAFADYPRGRDAPGREGTARLSPHLRFGEISVRRIWHAVHARMETAGGGLDGAGEAFLRELGWREFNIHLLESAPDMAERPLRAAFERFPWRDDPARLAAWRRGRTGYPIVDAAMRELWATGWMHNRARMIAASFLVKDLLLSWRVGEAWFRDTLLDADPANNPANWQWVAGCGADAAPWFRIFNPVLQGRRFDPAGDYVRRWVPELAGLPDDLVHTPWRAGGQPGYPLPVVDHAAARARALAAARSARGG